MSFFLRPCISPLGLFTNLHPMDLPLKPLWTLKSLALGLPRPPGPKSLSYQTLSAPSLRPPGGGGGHCLFEGRYPKQNSRPPVLCYHSPLSLSLLVYSPLLLRHQRKAYCYYCCYHGLPPFSVVLIQLLL